MATIDQPIKVTLVTKHKVRLAAAILNCTQAEFVDRAVTEFLGTYNTTLKQRVELARKALLGGDDALLKYLRSSDDDSINE